MEVVKLAQTPCPEALVSDTTRHPWPVEDFDDPDLGLTSRQPYPGWSGGRRVTPEELFGRFEKKFDSLMESIGGVAERITRLETQIKSSDDHRATMATSLGAVQTDLGELKATVRILEERYNNLKGEASELKSTVIQLEQAKWWIVGAAAGFSAAVSVATIVIEKYLTGAQ